MEEGYGSDSDGWMDDYPSLKQETFRNAPLGSDQRFRAGFLAKGGSKCQTVPHNNPCDARFERKPCVSNHELLRVENQSCRDERSTDSPPLTSLKAISLHELTVDKRHCGRALHGHFCVVPFKASAVYTVLEDATGRCVRVQMDSELFGSSSAEEIESMFPPGTNVTIREPFLKSCADGEIAVAIGNMCDVVLVDSECNLPQSSSAADILQHLESIRSEGNLHFSQQNWSAAAHKYSECIRKAICESEKGTVGNLNSLLLLSYSNRAEAQLRLEEYQQALNDSDHALEIDGKHVKSLHRKGRALHALSCYEKARAVLRLAFEECPTETSILDAMKATEISYQQSQTGEFSLAKYLCKEEKAPSCADFIGPVEVRPAVLYGVGHRGLFATRSVDAGEVLLLCNPLAVVHCASKPRRVNPRIQCPRMSKKESPTNDKSNRRLTAELVSRAVKSNRFLSQLYILDRVDSSLTNVLPMELFKCGSDWIPSNADLHIDVQKIERIVLRNSIWIADGTVNGFEENDHGNSTTCATGNETKNDSHGLWGLLSFVNHSCSANSFLVNIGDALLLRATRDLKTGDEVTISYFDNLGQADIAFHVLDIQSDVAFRDKIASVLSTPFRCKCDRCAFENSLRSADFEKIKIAYSHIHDAVISYDSGLTMNQGFQALGALERITDRVEASIISLRITEPRQQAWIRMIFFRSYLLKYASPGDGTFKIKRCVKMILGTLAATHLGLHALHYSASLLLDIEQSLGKDSKAYRTAEERVIKTFTTAFGKQSNKVMEKLLKRYATVASCCHQMISFGTASSSPYLGF